MSISADRLEALRQKVKIEGTDFGMPLHLPYVGVLRSLPATLLSFLRVRYTGCHRLPRGGPAILAGNHTSHVDPIAVIAGARRRTHYLAKDSHFKHLHTSIVMNLTGQIRTHRESGAADALSRGVDVLERGRFMGIFPEGTRSRRTEPPFLATGKTGVARLAASCPDVPVHPLAILDARDIMAPGDKIIRLWKPFQVNYGTGISWNEWLADAKGGGMDDAAVDALLSQPEHELRASMGALYRKFTDQLIASIRALGAP